ncbi:MAG TPA: methyltransferase domain-containing protein [Thermoanaerobaculia bacterium]|nr:methyltransferase domain-containing protein [Thermoanaerobaculia bacterium]
MGEKRWIEGPPEGLEGWRDVWRENRRFRPRSGLIGLLTAPLRALARLALGDDARRQRNFNEATLEMLEDQRRALASALDEIQGELRRLHEERQKFFEVAVERNDALLAALDRKAETALARIRDLAHPVLTAQPDRAPARDDWVYRRLEEGLRGDESEVREALAPYVEMAKRSGPAIDAGCGRGEFLALCAGAGVEALGYDTNERSVADARARGLRVELGSLPSCLGRHGDSTVGSILASHVVEHLPVDALIGTFAEAKRVLRPGGLFMIETPNAESLAVSASEFWRDPTHLGPRHLAALTLLAREYGFAVEQARTVHPFPRSRRLRLPDDASEELRALASQLDAILFGDQDLRLVLRREPAA